MRRICVIAALAALLIRPAAFGQTTRVVATSRSQRIRLNPVTPLTAATLAHPPAADRPWVRLNMPATADPAELKTEIRELQGNGIAGVEVGQGAFPITINSWPC